MKKSICLICAALVISSLFGCASKNQALKNNQNNTQIQSNITGKSATVNYKDGTYVGEGDTATNGIKQVATVKVSGGKIASVTLRNVDAAGAELSDSIVYSSSGGNNIQYNGGNGSPAVNKMPENPSGNGTVGSTPENAPGDKNGVGSSNAAPINPNNGVANSKHGHTVGAASAESIALSREELSSAIVKNQSTNISVNNGDSNMVSNWKTAVDRALNKAKK
jgi:uncharacterized protein with FMN-binding domain